MKVKGIVSLVISGLVIGALAVSYFMIMDNTAYPFEDSGVKTPDIAKKAYFKSFSDVKGNNGSDLFISQADLNQMSLNKRLEANGQDVPAGDMVGNFYVEVDGYKYNFFIETDLKFVKSRIKMETTLVDEGENFVFKIDSIKLGNFPGFVVTSFGIIDKIDLNTLFQRMNMSIQYDKANSRLIYSKENLKKDYNNLISLSTGDPAGLISGLMSHMDYTYDFKDGIHYKADFTKLISSELSDPSTENDHYKHYDDVKDCINNAFTYMKSEIVMNEVIETYLSSMTNHYYVATNMDLLLEDSVKGTPVADYYEPSYDKQIASIDEIAISNILRGSKAIGTYQAFPNSENPILLVVDNFYVDIFSTNSSSFMNYTIGINVNGVETRAVIQSRMIEKAADDYKVKFALQDIYYGSKLADVSFKEMIMQIFEKGMEKLTKDQISAYYDKDAKAVVFDFSTCIKTLVALDAYESAFYDQVGVRSLQISQSKVDEVGSINLRFKKG